MTTIKFDIFVSYRRSSSESANLIATSLRAKGYRVFFDVESLRGGKFNEQLYDVIDNCTDFLLILPPNALDRCYDPEDWVRKEVIRAKSAKKNIIPVTLAGFKWPEVMPEGMEDLHLYQALSASSNEYFDLSIRRLCENLLKSKPYRRLGKTARLLLFGSGGLISLIVVSFFLFRFLSIPLCDRVTAPLLRHFELLDELGIANRQFNEAWDDFFDDMNGNVSYDEKLKVRDNFLARISKIESSIDYILPADTQKFQFTGFEIFQLALRMVNAEQLEEAPENIAREFHNLKVNLSLAETIVRNGRITNSGIAKVKNGFDLFGQELKLNYYYYLAIMCMMPSSAVESCNEISRDFKCLKKVSEVSDLGREMTLASAEFDVMRSRAETLIDQLTSEEDDMNEKLANLNTFLYSAASIDEARKANEAEIAAHKEKIETMKAANDVRKAKLEELDRQISEVFADLKEQCHLEESDDMWYQWGKIVKFATWMGKMVENRKKADMQGVMSATSVTPEVAYAYLASLLNSFSEFHPESSALADGAKAFYREVSKGKRELSGVIVCAFRTGISHPVFKLGDVLIKVNGQRISTFGDVKEAKGEAAKINVEFLRVFDGKLSVQSVRDAGSIDDVGLTELKN